MIDFKIEFVPALSHPDGAERCVVMFMDPEFPYHQLLAFFNDPTSFGVKPEEKDQLLERAGAMFFFRPGLPGCVFSEPSWSHAGKYGLIDEARCVAKYWFEIATDNIGITLSQYMFFNVLEAAFRGHWKFVKAIGDEFLVGDWANDKPEYDTGIPFSWYSVYSVLLFGLERARRFRRSTRPFGQIFHYCISKGAGIETITSSMSVEEANQLSMWTLVNQRKLMSVDLSKERSDEVEYMDAKKRQLLGL